MDASGKHWLSTCASHKQELTPNTGKSVSMVSPSLPSLLHCYYNNYLQYQKLRSPPSPPPFPLSLQSRQPASLCLIAFLCPITFGVIAALSIRVGFFPLHLSFPTSHVHMLPQQTETVYYADIPMSSNHPSPITEPRLYWERLH